MSTVTEDDEASGSNDIAAENMIATMTAATFQRSPALLMFRILNASQRRATSDRDAEVRLRLIDATQRLLGRGGVASLTSRSITEAAGVNLAAVTYYFGSKDELVAESMRTMAQQLLEPVVDELESDSDPITKLLAAVRILNEVLTENRGHAAAYLQTLTGASTNNETHEPIVALVRRLETVLAAEIARQHDEASLPSWIEPDAMAQLVVAAVHGTLIASSLEPDRIDHTAIAAQFAQLLLAVRTTPVAEE